MAINPDNISFLIQQLQNSHINNFASYVAQVFNYLQNEIKDNPVFDKYESETVRWKKWLEQVGSFGQWAMPSTIENSKYLAYSLFKLISDNGNDWFIQLALSLYYDSSIIQNQRNFTSAFLGYFLKALNDIINANPEIEDSAPKKLNNRIVFIIHGHDNELKTEIQLLLNRAGVNSIVLH